MPKMPKLVTKLHLSFEIHTFKVAGRIYAHGTQRVKSASSKLVQDIPWDSADFRKFCEKIWSFFVFFYSGTRGERLECSKRCENIINRKIIIFNIEFVTQLFFSSSKNMFSKICLTKIIWEKQTENQKKINEKI